jgi:hypothetical protein
MRMRVWGKRASADPIPYRAPLRRDIGPRLRSSPRRKYVMYRYRVHMPIIAVYCDLLTSPLSGFAPGQLFFFSMSSCLTAYREIRTSTSVMMVLPIICFQ